MTACVLFGVRCQVILPLLSIQFLGGFLESEDVVVPGNQERRMINGKNKDRDIRYILSRQSYASTLFNLV